MKNERDRFGALTAGFTLIEMMVVIAVIGLLAAAVLTGLGPARNKGKDARIISGVQQVRTLAETLYNPASATPYAAVVPGEVNIAKVIADVGRQGGALTIMPAAPTTVYAAYSKLASKDTDFYCVDSGGFAGIITNVAAAADGTCE